MNRLLLSTFASFGVLGLGLSPLSPPSAVAAATAEDPRLERATTSNLTSISLPANCFRVTQVPASLTDALKNMVRAGGANVTQGDNEVLVLAGENVKRGKDGLKREIMAAFKTAGWTYEETKVEGKESQHLVVSLTRTSPAKRGVIGFWVIQDDTMLLALTEMVAASKDGSVAETPAPESEKEWETPPPPSGPTTPIPTIQLTPTQRTINVMGNDLPKLPTFAALAAKPNLVCGYVKDVSGRPLKGAVIGVRSSGSGGFYSGATAKTDEKGYYEVVPPSGSAEFYTASCTLDYGSGRAAFGLYPSDGEAEGFATANGHVENWVLLPYGIADWDKASDDPKYSGNYFGGTLTINYNVADSRFPGGNELPEGADIELTLVPSGPMLGGSKGKTFVMRRRVQDGAGQFYINNVPVGSYRLIAWIIQDGKPHTLKIKETGPESQNPFGLDPKEGDGSVALTFRPGNAAAGKAPANHGNWAPLSVTLSK